nr:hypothetical protein [Candidatus Sigynarchaeum springense]
LGFGGAFHLVPVEDGLAAVGISLDVTAFVSMVSSIIGVAIFLGTIYVMPYVEDLYWRKALVGLYVLDTKAGRILFKRDFQVARDMEPPAVSVSDRDSALMGGLSGIDDLVREMTSDAGGRLEFIDKEGLKFMLSWYKQLLFVVIARINLPVIKAKLAEFKNHFITQFADEMKDKAAIELRQDDLVIAVDRVFKGRDAA